MFANLPTHELIRNSKINTQGASWVVCGQCGAVEPFNLLKVGVFPAESEPGDTLPSVSVLVL